MSWEIRAEERSAFKRWAKKTLLSDHVWSTIPWRGGPPNLATSPCRNCPSSFFLDSPAWKSGDLSSPTLNAPSLFSRCSFSLLWRLFLLVRLALSRRGLLFTWAGAAVDRRVVWLLVWTIVLSLAWMKNFFRLWYRFPIFPDISWFICMTMYDASVTKF